jgi:hypothetical protein
MTAVTFRIHSFSYRISASHRRTANSRKRRFRRTHLINQSPHQLIGSRESCDLDRSAGATTGGSCEQISTVQCRLVTCFSQAHRGPGAEIGQPARTKPIHPVTSVTTDADWPLRCTLLKKVIRTRGKSAAKRSGELASADATERTTDDRMLKPLWGVPCPNHPPVSTSLKSCSARGIGYLFATVSTNDVVHMWMFQVSFLRFWSICERVRSNAAESTAEIPFIARLRRAMVIGIVRSTSFAPGLVIATTVARPSFGHGDRLTSFRCSRPAI